LGVNKLTTLFPNEKLDLDISTEISGKAFSDSMINEKYIKGDIRIVTEQARYPLNAITGMVESSSYRLNPEYQRRHRWDSRKKSRLIESLIMNVPIPPIFLYEYEFSKYEVMDGLQRLSAISDFYQDRFELEQLEHWAELQGRRYSTLPEKIREGIDRRYLSSVILLKETAKGTEEATKLKQLVFERLNSGGERLERQESRNAVYDGPLNALCLRLSKHPSLCRLWGIPEASSEEISGKGGPSEEREKHEAFRRMDDVELVLRFFAYRQKHLLHRGGDFGSYLDRYLDSGNRYPAEILSALEKTFVDTIQTVEAIFGTKAFWLYRKRKESWGWLGRATTTVYDPLMSAVSDRLDRAKELIQSSEKIRKSMPKFYTDNYDTFEGRNVNRSALVARDESFAKLLDTFLG
jgi:hypothetical protein